MAQNAPHIVSTPDPTPPPRRGARRERSATLPVGTEVWYRLRTNDELIPATVIDTWKDDYGMETVLLPAMPGCVHLEIELDPQRHCAASERGLRQNVAEGNASGQFGREYPAMEAEAWAMVQLRRQILQEENVKRAQGRTL